MADPMRLQLLNALKAKFVALMTLAPAPAYVPSQVQIGPLGDPDNRKKLSIGIVAGKERKSDLFPFMDSILPIAVEFQLVHNKGDPDPGVFVEKVLGFLQNVVMADTTVGGKALDIQEVGNEIDLTTWGDRSPAGVIYWEAKYRHSNTDVSVAG